MFAVGDVVMNERNMGYAITAPGILCIVQEVKENGLIRIKISKGQKKLHAAAETARLLCEAGSCVGYLNCFCKGYLVEQRYFKKVKSAHTPKMSWWWL